MYVVATEKAEAMPIQRNRPCRRSKSEQVRKFDAPRGTRYNTGIRALMPRQSKFEKWFSGSTRQAFMIPLSIDMMRCSLYGSTDSGDQGVHLQVSLAGRIIRTLTVKLWNNI